MESEDREDIIRAKKAISPTGLEDQSAEGNSGISGELPTSDLPIESLPNDALEDKYMDTPDKPGENARMMHPNRKADDKLEIDKRAY